MIQGGILVTAGMPVTVVFWHVHHEDINDDMDSKYWDFLKQSSSEYSFLSKIDTKLPYSVPIDYCVCACH